RSAASGTQQGTPLMTEHILTTWLLTYAVHGALFAALAAVAERTCWGAVASRRDAFWKLALVGGIVTSTVFVAAGSAPAGAAGHLSPQGVIAPALTSDGVVWLAAGGVAITAVLAPRPGPAWPPGAAHGRRVASGRATRRATPRPSTGPGRRAPPGDSRSCRRSRDVIVQPYA